MFVRRLRPPRIPSARPVPRAVQTFGATSGRPTAPSLLFRPAGPNRVLNVQQKRFISAEMMNRMRNQARINADIRKRRIVENKKKQTPEIKQLKSQIAQYVKAKQFDLIESLMKSQPREVRRVLWPILLIHYTEHGYAEMAFDVFTKMQADNVELENRTFGLIMRMLARLKDEERFMKVWDAMKEADFPHDTVAYTQRINLYRLLNKPQEAIKMYYEMRKKRIAADQHTFGTLIVMFADLITVDAAEQLPRTEQREYQKWLDKLLENMKVAGFEWTWPVYNALIRMHCRTGNIAEAHAWLTLMKKKKVNRDPRSYLPLIKYYAERGNVEKVRELYHQARSDNVLVRVDVEDSARQLLEIVRDVLQAQVAAGEAEVSQQ